MKNFPDYTRRRFLAHSAKAGGLLALPAFASAQSPVKGTVSGPPQRLVVIHIPLSLYPHALYPDKTGTDFKAPRLLQPLEPFRGKYTIFKGLDHPEVAGGHHMTNTILTGTNFQHHPKRRYTISLDQFIDDNSGASQTRFGRMQIGSTGAAGAPLSFDANGTPDPDIVLDPVDFYQRLFLTNPEEQRRLEQEIASRRSILDGMHSEIKLLDGKLDSTDRARFEHYRTAIRNLEGNMSEQMRWKDVPRPMADDFQLTYLKL